MPQPRGLKPRIARVTRIALRLSVKSVKSVVKTRRKKLFACCEARRALRLAPCPARLSAGWFYFGWSFFTRTRALVRW